MSQATNVKVLPTIHNNRNQVKSYHASADTEDVSFNEVAGMVKKKVTVVYNQFSLEAIIAAAMLKNCYPEFTIITAAQRWDKNDELYVWIGVNSQDVVDREMAKNGIQHRQYSSHDPQPVDENGYRPNLIDRICEDFKVRQSPSMVSLSFHASRFNRSDMDIKDLVMVYGELLNAVDILNDKEDPRKHPITVKDYLEAMTDVKKKMDRSYHKMVMADGTKEKEVLYTNFPDHQFILANRLIKMSHCDFVNHVVGLGNNLIYTSLYDPVMREDMSNVVVLN